MNRYPARRLSGHTHAIAFSPLFAAWPSLRLCEKRASLSPIYSQYTRSCQVFRAIFGVPLLKTKRIKLRRHFLSLCPSPATRAESATCLFAVGLDRRKTTCRRLAASKRHPERLIFFAAGTLPAKTVRAPCDNFCHPPVNLHRTNALQLLKKKPSAAVGRR